MRYVIIDGLNFMHRARSGFKLGPAPLLFNFMRNLRALVELLKADKVFYVLEGYPKFRHDEMPTYKENRVLQPTDPDFEVKARETVKFLNDAENVAQLLASCFPVTMVRHPDYECDDTILNVVKSICLDTGELDNPHEDPSDEAIVVSTDTDFIQLLQCFINCKLYNPVQKKYVTPPDCNYVQWKSLRGDSSDNIPGIPGVSDKRAVELLKDPAAMQELLADPQNFQVYERNTNLITLHDFTDDDLEGLESHVGEWQPDRIKQVFEGHGFKSIVNEKSWAKFVETFQHLTVTYGDENHTTSTQEIDQGNPND